MGVEICGGLFLILSLAFKERFDVFASVSYGVGVVSYPLFFRKDHPTQYYAFAGYGCNHRDRRSLLEPHRAA